MTYSESARAVDRRNRSPASWAVAGVSATGIVVYGCSRDEEELFREMAPGFGVVPTVTEAAVSADNVELALGNRCVSVDHKTRIGSEVLLGLSRVGVEYISTRSIGYDHIDVRCAESLGIVVENVAYSPDGVADYTVMLMLMAIRNVRSVIRRVDAGDYRLDEVRGKELRDLTVGVVGVGRIGTAVVERLRGFGCRVLAHDSRVKVSAEHVSLDELLEQSDVVTLHAPLNADTRHLLDRRRIGQMKVGAFVVNTGRGGLIDTDALLSALESGRLGGAALDVLEGEEGVFYADCRGRAAGSVNLARLRELPNVAVTPHTAYYTDRALRDTVENSIVNCRAFDSGKKHWI
ncbi:NAD(P)-dependent oxidoreductase [Lentzea nigeriaca]|uniref:NAD(P)-dependent oxidoreductase n=1 Tax=Lentzea nigeriaca TaxID=1128665 RepID=UPI00195D0226|nr:NAD(P)-dependent oxidoreductase [Lentzea nigeriaca]MBM7861073.1 D-specific alpha-keto acid dehydrogenase [Lentzea nigeriaca]